MLIKNGLVLDNNMKKFYQADILLSNGKIEKIGINLEHDGEIINADGKYVIPGLIDIHTHGAVGVDIISDTPENIRRMSEFYASHGVTTVFPTTLTASFETIENAMKNICLADNEDNPVTFRGVHVEGPFISEKRPGVHNISLLCKPDIEEVDRIKSIIGDRALYLTVASEYDNGIRFIKDATSKGYKISLGHTDAVCDEVKEALKAGATSFTHLFNAMRPIHHREPGTVGTALASDAYCELIVDGHHIHEDAVLMTYKIKGSDRLILVTDSLQAAGMPNGEYDMGDVHFTVKDGVALNPDGHLAGSTLNLFDAVKNLMKFASCSFAEAVLCATRNPAMASGIYHKVGSIKEGKDADIVIVNDDMTIDMTISRGRKVFTA